MTDIALKMLFGECAKYAVLVTGICFATILMTPLRPRVSVFRQLGLLGACRTCLFLNESGLQISPLPHYCRK